MNDVLFHYERVNPTTWFYLASLLSLALFFKFNRLWSVRNVDLLGLILLAPGLLAVEYGRSMGNTGVQATGFVWLFVVSGVLLVRMLVDSTMVRRPMLEPNLTTGGLVFLGGSLLVFLLANVITWPLQREDLAGPAAADRLRAGEPGVDTDQLAHLGPGYPLLFLLPEISTGHLFGASAPDAAAPPGDPASRARHETTARVMAILCQLAIVLGMVTVGWRHFGNVRLGIAAAVLYLLLPYTAMMTARVDHALPGALVLWAVAAYRLPILAGVLVGLAIGTIYYPLFLLPLWCSFYWERGVRRFALGVTVALAALVLTLWIYSSDTAVFIGQVRRMFGWIFPTDVLSFRGFWAMPSHDSEYRLPVLALFVALMATFAIWPAPKNLGTLMSCSAAVLLGSQFWKAHDGGLFMAWFLPLLLLVVFRPNLENRVAMLVLEPDWIRRRGPARVSAGGRAA